MPARALLRACRHHAIVTARRVYHPAAFLDKQGERLLDVDIFAGDTGHDGDERVPVVRGRDYDSLNIFIIEQLSKVTIRFGLPAARRQALLEPRLIDVGHRGQVRITLHFEILNVFVADQPEADEADLHAVIRAGNA